LVKIMLSNYGLGIGFKYILGAVTK